MLVAFRLAGLSALEGHYAGVNAVKRGSELEPRFRAGWFFSFMTRELADRLVEGARLLALPV
jgi:hypothetical protein